MSRKWYTNGDKQVLAEICPEGYRPGRLPVSEETRKKHSQNNGWKTMTEEQKKARALKISNTINSRTPAEKQAYSAALSKARKGKGLGITPWNKGTVGLQTAWNKGFTMTEEAKQHLRDVYNNLPEEEKQRRKAIISKTHKGKIPWNFGLTYTLDPELVKKAKEKEIATKKLRRNFQASKLEEVFYEALCQFFKPAEIQRQYFDAKRYPFNCDFYIKPLDLFIELNGNWTHGFRPYSADDEACTAQLAAWQEKAKTSSYYENAIYTWTDLDVRKRKTAEQNDLLFVQLYTEKDIQDFFKLLEKV